MRKRRRIIEEAEETSDEDNTPLARLLENELDDEYCVHTDGMEEDLIIIDGDTVDTESDVVEESFCVVEYRLRETDKKVFYICKILSVEDSTLSVSSLRKHGKKFHMPDVPDINTVDKRQIKKVLPKPQSFGGTNRLKSVFVFPNVYFAKDIDIR